MTSEQGDLLPEGAELRVRVKTEALLKAATVMSVAAKDRSAAMGPQMLRLRAVEKTELSAAHLLVAADTGEMQLEQVVPEVEVLEAGSVSVLLPEFLAKMRAAESKAVEISVLDAEKVLLRTSRTRWEISGEVGHWEQDSEDAKFVTKMAASQLAAAVAAVLPAVPKNGGRPVLERVHIQNDWAVSTNGALLLKAALGHGELFQIDLPRSVASLVSSRKTGDVRLYVGKKTFSLEYDKVHIQVTKPLLPYPDVSKVETAAMIEDHELLIVDAEEMLASLTRVRAYSSNDRPEVSVRTVKKADGWAVLLTSEDRNGNMTREALKASWQSEKKMVATFHVAHLASLLKTAAGETELLISANGKSLLIEDLDRGRIAIAQQIVS